jgi:ribonuclease HI
MDLHKSMSKPLVYIYADESCLGVQFTDRDSPGGAGGLVEMWRGDQWLRRDYWISEPATTNNRMAIRGAFVGLEELKKPCRVIFVSDSQYLVRAMGGWIHAWKRAGWKRKTGALENAELWQELDRAAQRHDVTWEWVRGHAGHPQNEFANHLATRAAKKQDASNGFVDSEFVKWLEEQREKYDKYMDFNEWSPPHEII